MPSQQQPGQPAQAAPEEQGSIERAGPGRVSVLRRFSEQLDRVFDDLFPGFGRHSARGDTWWPQIEVSHRDNKLTVTADVPGLKREDINVELGAGELRISGERRSESEKREGGYYTSERSYGSFTRAIRLPEGAKPETASAIFDNGVLKIEIETKAPQGVGRRIEIREGSPH